MSEETRQNLGWDKSFDLAYSIFCPIMFDVENIRAMHDASMIHVYGLRLVNVWMKP